MSVYSCVQAKLPASLSVLHGYRCASDCCQFGNTCLDGRSCARGGCVWFCPKIEMLTIWKGPNCRHRSMNCPEINFGQWISFTFIICHGETDQFIYSALQTLSMKNCTWLTHDRWCWNSLLINAHENLPFLSTVTEPEHCFPDWSWLPR